MKCICFVLMIAFVGLVMPSCSKDKIEQKVEDLVVQVMTDGIWIVTSYQEGTNDLTSLFNGWESQFFENKSCIARNTTTGAVVNGTWDGSYSTQSFTGNFGNTAPINKMNGTWKVIRSTYTTGQFSRQENGMDYKLEITKK